MSAPPGSREFWLTTFTSHLDSLMPGTPPFKFEIDTLENCAVVTWVGDVDLEALAESQKQIVADPRFKPGMNFLVDGRRANLVGVDYSGIRAKILLADRASASTRGWSRSAIIVGSRKDYGIVRQMASLLNDEPSDIERRPFYDVAEACTWLGISLDVLPPLADTDEPSVDSRRAFDEFPTEGAGVVDEEYG